MKAEELGLVVGMLPTWGHLWGRVGQEPPYVFTVENARLYGRYVGARYRRKPVGFYFKDANRYDRFDDYDVRQAAYWSLLAGACGHTYGNNNVWQMWTPKHEPAFHADVPRHEALDHPGAFQVGFVRRLFESRPFAKLQPDSALVVDGPRTGGAKIRAARASDGSFAFIYSPRGESR